MKRTITLIICLGAIALLLSACGGGDDTAEKVEGMATSPDFPFYADTILPGSIEIYEIARLDSVEIVMPEEAEDYLGQSAQLYEDYHFIGMAAAEYTVKGLPASAEIAQFPHAEEAYGFYSMLRPNGTPTGQIGSESFTAGNSLYFTAGDFVVTVSVEGDSSAQISASSLLAQEINSRITQHRSPPFFTLYPARDKVPSSSKYYSRDYLDIEGIDRVYTQTYFVEGDSAVFFMTVDESGEQFLILSEHANSVGTVEPAPESFPYDEGYSLIYDDPEHGTIVAGLVRAKLVGVVGYKHPKYEDLASRWVLGLGM